MSGTEERHDNLTDPQISQVARGIRSMLTVSGTAVIFVTMHNYSTWYNALLREQMMSEPNGLAISYYDNHTGSNTRKANTRVTRFRQSMPAIVARR